jgi:hypothetical protein
MGIGVCELGNPEYKEKRERIESALVQAYQVYQDFPACVARVAR